MNGNKFWLFFYAFMVGCFTITFILGFAVNILICIVSAIFILIEFYLFDKQYKQLLKKFKQLLKELVFDVEK